MKFLIEMDHERHNVMMGVFLLAYFIQERGFMRENAIWFSALYGLGLAIGGSTITRIADKFGPKYMMATAQTFAIVYTLIAWFAPHGSTAIAFAAFTLTGFAQISDNVGYTNMCLLCCPTPDKSTYSRLRTWGYFVHGAHAHVVGKIMDLKISPSRHFHPYTLHDGDRHTLSRVVLDNPKSTPDMKAAKKA